jgi:hypothetical protein
MPRGIARRRHRKLPARIVGIFGLVLAISVPSGCAGMDLWQRATDFHRFIEVRSCGPWDAPPLESRKLYQVVSTRWFMGDPCPGAVCPTSSQEHSDRYANLVTVINEQGVLASAKVWIVSREDYTDVARNSDFPDSPSPPSNVGFHWPPPDRTGEICVNLVSVPWQKDRDRPFWVADETLLLSVESLEADSKQSWLLLKGLTVLLLVGTVFVRIGNFDCEPWEKWDGVRASAGIMIVGCALLFLILTRGVHQQFEQVRKIQEYYASYAQMPKVNGYLLPVTGQAVEKFFLGIGRFYDFSGPLVWFRAIATITLALWLLVSFKRLYMGLYWVYANLPVEVVFNRARARGRWPKAHELARAIRKGTIGKSAWQSRAMELKARIFKQKLDETASNLERKRRKDRR